MSVNKGIASIQANALLKSANIYIRLLKELECVRRPKTRCVVHTILKALHESNIHKHV